MEKNVLSASDLLKRFVSNYEGEEVDKWEEQQVREQEVEDAFKFFSKPILL